MTRIEEDQVNGDKLRQLREARGWDWAQIARLSSLSVSQVQALESGSAQCFYSLQIKNNAARKVAQVLGVSQADVMIVREEPVGQADDAVQTNTTPISLPLDRRNLHLTPQASSWMGYGVMSLVLVVGLGWYGFRSFTLITPASAVMAAATANLPALPEPAAPTQPPKDPTSALNSAPVQSQTAVVLAQTATPSVPEGPKQKPGELEMTPASLSASTEPSCPFESNATVLEASNPTKSPERITLMLHKAGVLCVQDSTGKVWQEDLKPWLGRTFNGKAPWKLYSSALPNADVYFQGEKLRLAAVNSRTIALNGKQLNR